VRSVGRARMIWTEKDTSRKWTRLVGPVPDACLQPIRGLPPVVDLHAGREKPLTRNLADAPCDSVDS